MTFTPSRPTTSRAGHGQSLDGLWGLALLLLAMVTPVALSQDVFQPPLVTVPDRANVLFFKANTNFNLKCNAHGIPSPTYEWWLNGSPIRDQGLATFNPQTGDLQVKKITKDAMFQCRAFNQAGGHRAVSVSHLQTIKLIKIGRFDDKVSTVESIEYASARLECRHQGLVEGPKEFVAFKWYNDKNNQRDLDGGRLFISSEGTLYFTYTLESDDSGDSANFKCGVGDKNHIELGSETVLKVEKAESKALKPRLLHNNDGVQAVLDTSAKLECMFSGYDPQANVKLPEIQWYDSAGVHIKADGRKYGLTQNNRVLTIANVDQDDEQAFLCQAENSAGASPKESVSLNVTSPPIWVKAPQSITVTQESDGVIECRAKSMYNELAPGPPVWSINGQVFVKERWQNIVLSPEQTHLTVKNVVKPDDIMCVQCVVTNSVGRTMGGACINVILPITIAIECKKCELQSRGQCDCSEWHIGKGEAVEMRLSFTTDPAYQELTKQKWVVNATEYKQPALPPHMKYDKESGYLVMETGSLSDKEFSKLGGRYRYVVYHSDDSKYVDINVVLKSQVPDNVASAGTESPMWIIGLIIGLVFIVIVIIIIIAALVCRKKQEGVYNLGKKETTAGLDPKKDLEKRAFSDLSRPEVEDPCYQEDEERSRSDEDDVACDRLIQRGESNA